MTLPDAAAAHPAASAAAGMRKPAANYLTFALANLPLAGLTVAISIYLPRHFAAHVGVSLAAVGSAFALVRLIDISVDLVLGLAMDRTRTPFGRYRAWMVAGVPVLMLATYKLFIDTAGMTSGSLVVWLLVLYLGTSILALSHAAWAATLVSRYDERARIFGLMAAVGVVGSLIVFLAPVLLAQLGATDTSAVPAMGWIIMAAAPVAVAVVVLTTPERIREDLKQVRFSLATYWDLVRRPTVLRIVVADFCLSLGPGWLSATVLFLLLDAKALTLTQANVLLAISISAGFLGAPLMSRLAGRISKHRALIVAGIGYAATLIGLVLTPAGNFVLVAANLFVMGFFNAAFAALIRAMTADVSDELRLAQGQERAGLLYAITTLTTKAAGAFSIFLTFSVLDAIGYDARAGSGNSPEAIWGLEVASILGPTIFVLLGALCCMGYGLTAKRHDEIRLALARHDAGAKVL